MNKKNFLALAALAVLAVGSVQADSKLVVTDSSTKTVVASAKLGDVKKLTFTGGKLVVTLSDLTTQETPLTAHLALTFGESTTSISPVAGENGQLKIQLSGEQLAVSGLSAATDATLYAVGGQVVASLKGWDGSPVSTAALGKGIYILKLNNKTFKFVKK